MITTHLFGFFTAAAPDQVWEALTDGGTGHYLRGVTLRSEWRPGSPVELIHAGVVAARGDVVVADPHRRLSFAIESGHDPSTLVTWELRPAAGGTVVRLYVDEPGAVGDDGRDVEDAWLPTLAGLQGVLAAEVVDGRAAN